MNHVQIIAEAGVNHNGKMELAYRLIDEAKKAGVDVIKFQNFKTEKMCKADLAKEEYQQQADKTEESQYQMLKRLELSEEDTVRLKEYTEAAGLGFMSTPYDYESVDFLDRIDLETFKIGSGEITDLPFLRYVAGKKRAIILSTGASTMEEIRQAVETIRAVSDAPLSLLHCTSAYPTPPEHVNLKAMLTLEKEFGLPTGFSDHTRGITADVAAVALGARIVEKHFTLDKDLPGPDHKASLDPEELRAMVAAVRECEAMLGSPEKAPTPVEQETIKMGRRSILSARPIAEGQAVSAEDLIIKRPGTGIPPSMFDQIVGSIALHDIPADTVLQLDDFKG